MKQPLGRLVVWLNVMLLCSKTVSAVRSGIANGSQSTATLFPARESDQCPKTGEISEYRRRYGLDFISETGDWEVRDTADKGLGVFAAQDIAKGTHLMVEAPLFTIDPGSFHADKGYQVGALEDAVEASFGNLNTSSKEEYLACHEGRSSGASGSRELNIFISNAYSMPDGRVGIFPRIAKINHSCRPNSVNTFNEDRGSRVIWAGRDIAAGEEITVTYVPLAETTEKRRARLSQYGFRCGCEACRASEGDDERLEIHMLMSELNAVLLNGGDEVGDIMSRAERLASLVEQEGLVEYFASAFRLAALASLRKGDRVVARKWLARELEIHDFANEEAARALRRDMAQIGLI